MLGEKGWDRLEQMNYIEQANGLCLGICNPHIEQVDRFLMNINVVGECKREKQVTGTFDYYTDMVIEFNCKQLTGSQKPVRAP